MGDLLKGGPILASTLAGVEKIGDGGRDPGVERGSRRKVPGRVTFGLVRNEEEMAALFMPPAA
jgi:hypothetical protein